MSSQYAEEIKREKLEYYMPSPSDRDPSSRRSSQNNSRPNSSLLQAGQSIVFQKNTI